MDLDIPALDLYDLDLDPEPEEVNGICSRCGGYEASERADFRLDDTCTCCLTCPAVATVLLHDATDDDHDATECYCEGCGRDQMAAAYAKGWAPFSLSLVIISGLGRAA